MVTTILEYQLAAERTMPKAEPDRTVLNAVMGLCGEAGECVDIVKKHMFQGHELKREKLIEEAGDVAWYLAQLATGLGIPLAEIFDKNIEKLKQRYQGEGFTAEESMNRPEYSLTRDDLNAYGAANPSMATIVGLASIDKKGGVEMLVYPPELRLQAEIVMKRLPILTEWMKVNREKDLTIGVEVRGGV